MNVFVTGGAGFIGSHVCQALLKSGHSVTVYDNLTTGHVESLPEEATFIDGDIRDLGDVRTAMIGHDAVIHLAGQALVNESVENPQKSYDVNIGGGYNVLVAMRELGIKKLVYSSTAAVYGEQTKMPVPENADKIPTTPYGATKLSVENLISAYVANYKLSATVLRYFNPFGPGENHDPETHVVPNFMSAIANNEPLPIYWNGKQKRDFFYVKDLAEAHVRALKLKGFSVYNLGSGKAVSVKKLAETIAEIADKKPKYKDLGERKGDPSELLADVSKAKKELNWKPTPLKEALQETWEDFIS